jgi:hypothetical protein
MKDVVKCIEATLLAILVVRLKVGVHQEVTLMRTCTDRGTCSTRTGTSWEGAATMT